MRGFIQDLNSKVSTVIDIEGISKSCQIGFWSFTKNNGNYFSQTVFDILCLSTFETTLENFSSTIISDDLEDFKNCPLFKVVSDWSAEDEAKKFEFEFRIKGPLGLRYIRGKGIINLDKNLRDIVLEGLIEDVTECKTQENKKIEKLSKMAIFGELSSNIVHEISTPLSVISFYANYLIKHFNEKNILDEKTQKYLNTIEKIVKQTGKMVSSMRYFMSSEEGGEYESADLKQIINDTLDLCNERLMWADVKTEVEILEDIHLECRSVQICQILTNLVANSINSIKVKDDRWIKISAKTKNDRVIIEVLDSGKGISPEIARNIMKPFFTTRFNEGTGLGLSIGLDLAQQHGGKIYYEPNSQNTLFVLELPLKHFFKDKNRVKTSE